MIKPKNLIYSKQGNLLSIWRILRLLLIGFLLVITINSLFRLFKSEISFDIARLIFVVAIILVTILIDKERIESLGIELKSRSIIFLICGIIWAYFYTVQIEIVEYFTFNTGFQLVNPFSKTAILSLGYFIFIVALVEELLFRSYLINNISRDSNVVVALIISFVLFTFVHIIVGSWQNVTITWVDGFVFSLLLGLTFIMTKNIFLAVGFHGAYNSFSVLSHSLNNHYFNAMVSLIIMVTNLLLFYLIYSKVAAFDIKTLTKA
jgi:membrane protease YdiL (CAAX protease family)